MFKQIVNALCLLCWARISGHKSQWTSTYSFFDIIARRSVQIVCHKILILCPAGWTVFFHAVGQEYIDEARNESGVAVGFYCKLCDCKFTDPNAKLLHMKGRRHRLQYKVRQLSCSNAVIINAKLWPGSIAGMPICIYYACFRVTH